jgi:predicted DNA-binding ribbon-helix-helix protein
MPDPDNPRGKLDPGSRTVRNMEIWGRRTSMRLEIAFFEALVLIAKHRGVHPNVIVTEAAELANKGGSTATSAVRVYLAGSANGVPPSQTMFSKMLARKQRNLFLGQRRVCISLEDFFWEGVTNIAREKEMSLDGTVERLAMAVPGATSRASAIRVAVLQHELALANAKIGAA